MKRSSLGLALAALLLTVQAHAAVVTASFASLGSNAWTVDLTLLNDGSPAEISGFTVYFDEPSFSGLLLSASPASWDSLVIQPDLDLASAGFLDSVLLDRSQPLLLGQSQGGFTVQFTYAGIDAPMSLSYEIVDDAYNVLFAGQTVAPPPPVAAIPEPSTYLLTAFGLGAIAWVTSRRRRTSSGAARTWGSAQVGV